METEQDHSDNPGGAANKTDSNRTILADDDFIRHIVSRFAKFVEIAEEDTV
jgi:hypothetical protein